MLNQEWIRSLISYDTETGEGPSLAAPDDTSNIGRTIIDGTLVIYDSDDVPVWLQQVLDMCDENGNTNLAAASTL